MSRRKTYNTNKDYKLVWYQQNRQRMLLNMQAFRVSPKGRYAQQRTHAKERGISWEFTFETWWKVWEDSGKWDMRGRTKLDYVMCRLADIGPYRPDNVRIDTVENNSKERIQLKKGNSN